jgi:hypothetical protein
VHYLHGDSREVKSIENSAGAFPRIDDMELGPALARAAEMADAINMLINIIRITISFNCEKHDA